MSVAVCGFNRLLRNMGGLFHGSFRYSQKALRFLFILGKSFFPKLHICALHTRQPPALAKRLEQLGIFMQPRSDEFGPLLAEGLQGCAQLRVLLRRFRQRVSACFDEPCEIKKRHGCQELAGIVTRWLVCHFFRPLFARGRKRGAICTREKEKLRRWQKPLGMLRHLPCLPG
jgi:hypothetical protein